MFRRKTQVPTEPLHANTQPFFESLTKLGFSPAHVVDVGARRGGWTSSEPAFSRFQVFAFSMLAAREFMTRFDSTVFDITDLNRTPTFGPLWNVAVAVVKTGGDLDSRVSS